MTPMFPEFERRQGQCGPDHPVTHITSHTRHHADYGGQPGAHGGHGQEGGGGEDKINIELPEMISMFCLQANTERPAWTEEELQTRGEVFTDLGEAGGFSDAGLKKQIMVDRSAPVVNGEQEDIALKI